MTGGYHQYRKQDEEILESDSSKNARHNAWARTNIKKHNQRVCDICGKIVNKMVFWKFEGACIVCKTEENEDAV